MKVLFIKTDDTDMGPIVGAVGSMPNGLCQATIEPVRATRSNEQNSYYWGVVIGLISEYTGYDPDDVHRLMEAKFLSTSVRMKGDKRRRHKIPKKSSKLTTKEFAEYVEQIKIWAAKEGVYIPDPNANQV